MAEKSETKAVLRDAKGRFIKGGAPVSPGRPASAKEFRQWCQEVMAGIGRERLREAIRDPKHRFHSKAVELVLAYAYGKPPQAVEISGPDGGPVAVAARIAGLTDEELRQLVERAKADS